MICFVLMTFPCLETLVVDVICAIFGCDLGTHACLESITLHISLVFDYRQVFIGMFSRLHLPMLRKLTLAEPPNKLEADYLLAVLKVASRW
ncbi:hypothetical protein F4604DRAFT_1843572 [Suillus subluteus]|nr:hypothetical protein F4604DRAFT_1843572 [Suillus subluteus]